MSNVIDLDAHRSNPHLAGPAKCLACQHEWAAAAPVGTYHLECPRCHTKRGVWRFACNGRQGIPFWACRCGSDVFVLTTAELVCTSCGRTQTGWYEGQDPDPPPYTGPRRA